MAKIEYKGISPADFFKQSMLEVITRVNQETLDFEREIIEATPVGVAGYLRQGWSVQLATFDSPIVKISQARRYFIPVEVGRRPGKGISQEGMVSLRRWAKRKLGLNRPQAAALAKATATKYYKKGRPAQGFLGLAKKGDKAPASLPEEITPVRDSILYNYFRAISFRFK